MIKLLAMLSAVVLATGRPDTYSTKYDSIDLDKILGNDRVLGSYIRCLLDKGACTSEGRELRQHIPDAIQTSCSKCTDVQKDLVRRASRFVMDKKPEDWKLLQAKYDPSGERKEEFDKFLNEQQR